MSTTTESQGVSKLDSLRYTFWNVTYGLFWGALALLLLGLWIYSKYWETAPIYAWGIWVLFAIALVAGAVEAGQYKSGQHLGTEQREQQLQRGIALGTRAILGLSVILLLLTLGVLLQAPSKLGAFPEVSSGILLAVIGLLAGLLLLSAPEKRFGQQQILEALVRGRKQVMMVCLGLGGVLFLLGIIIFYGSRAQWQSVFPQGGGLMLLGLVFLGVGLWDLVASNREVNVANMRFLVLLAGGSAGLIIAVMTAIRAWMWMDIISGGMTGWQGERSWQLWLCIWLELFGLALMFGSLYLAQADIRFNVALRRLLYGYNAVFTGLLVLAALVILNVVVYASFPYTANWTKDLGVYSLSDKSKNILSKLKKPTTIWIIMSQGARDYTNVKNLLENCQAYSSQLDVRDISPDKDTKQYNELLKRFPKLDAARQGAIGRENRGILIAYGYSSSNPPEMSERIPHSFIPASELSDDKMSPMTKPTDQPERRREFRGENLIMTQLSFLVGGETKPVLYFTQSNGEVNIKNSADAIDAGSNLADKLENANYQVRQLFWGVPGAQKGSEGGTFSKKTATDRHKVPSDAMALVVAWPRDSYTADVLEAMEAYIKNGGKMVVMTSLVDPKGDYRKTDLEGLLKKYAVDLGENYVIDVTPRLPTGVSYTVAIVEAAQASDNEIAKAFARSKFLFDAPRTVKPLTGATGYTAQTILEVPHRQGEYVWAETDMKTLINPDRYVDELIRKRQVFNKDSGESLPVAVAVTDRDKKPRLVVFGDGKMASNAAYPLPYGDLIVSSVAWLGERPSDIGIPAMKTNYYRFPAPTEVSRSRMVLLPLALMSIGLIGVGMGVWVVRRP